MTHIHLIGIGGTGLSAIALVLLESGYTVSGSDLEYAPLAKSVANAGARFHLGHMPEHVIGADMIVRSSAIQDDNVEVQAAISSEIPVLKRSEFLGRLMTDKQAIAVSGTHGKTSTTAMIAWALTQLGHDPSFILGGVISGLETNARAGKGSVFVIEADEYDRMFLGLNPDIAVITNIEHDHPDCYATQEEFKNAFREFIQSITPDGVLIACGDDPGTQEVVAAAVMDDKRILTYGIRNPDVDFWAKDLKSDPERGGFGYKIIRRGKVTAVSLRVPGKHNVLNSLAAFAVSDILGISLAKTAEALSDFEGTGRRFEIVGEVGGVTVISDYAHHPTEIKATLSAARDRYPDQKVWAVWQPHTYSRTKLLLTAFAESFSDAHFVFVTEVYRAREPLDISFSGKQIVDLMEHPNAKFIPNIMDAANLLSAKLKYGDVLIVLSAGDADQICSIVMNNLNETSEGEEYV
jgi:UDP-N-acetylmuramate--alanine ligase